MNAFRAELALDLVKGQDAPPSAVSDRPVTLLFSNQTRGASRIVRLDETGERGEPIAVQGASRWLVETFAGHTWLVLGEDDRPLGHIVGPEIPARIIIQ